MAENYLDIRDVLNGYRGGGAAGVVIGVMLSGDPAYIGAAGALGAAVGGAVYLGKEIYGQRDMTTRYVSADTGIDFIENHMDADTFYIERLEDYGGPGGLPTSYLRQIDSSRKESTQYRADLRREEKGVKIRFTAEYGEADKPGELALDGYSDVGMMPRDLKDDIRVTVEGNSTEPWKETLRLLSEDYRLFGL